MRACLVVVLLAASASVFAQSTPLATRSPGYESVLVADLAADFQRAAKQLLMDQVATQKKKAEPNAADVQPAEQTKPSRDVTLVPSGTSLQSGPAAPKAAKSYIAGSADAVKSGRETRTASGAMLRIVDCSGLYQGVAVVPPKSLDLARSTPSNTYSDVDATGGIFPIVREAIDFYWSVCIQKAGYAIRPPNYIWLFGDELPPQGIALNDEARYVMIQASGTNSRTPPYSWSASSWSVRNGLADFVNKENTNRYQQEAERTRQAKVAAQREQDNARRSAFLKQYKAFEIPKMSILRSNPFSIEGRVIAIPVNFYQMTSPTVGRFEVLTHSLEDHGGQIVVSDIPRGTFSQPTRAFLAAKVLGLTPVQGGEGGEPHLKYAGVVICSNPNASCP